MAIKFSMRSGRVKGGATRYCIRKGWRDLESKKEKRKMAAPSVARAWDKPAISLVDVETRRKIRLRLRTMSFQREVSNLKLPPEILDRHNILVTHRNKRNENIYMMVAVWYSLRAYERFWTPLGFQSEEEYLAYYGLPDGTTLAGWAVMVNLFDKQTFILLGDTVLSFMMRFVGEYQKDSDMRKRNYQAIFDQYCDRYDAFDKETFYDVVREYVKKTYEEPLAHQAGKTCEEFVRGRQTRKVGGGKRRTVQAVEGKQQVTPRIEKDFDWREQSCPYCLSKITVIEAFLTYTQALENLIRQELGETKLPERPLAIQNL